MLCALLQGHHAFECCVGVQADVCSDNFKLPFA